MVSGAQKAKSIAEIAECICDFASRMSFLDLACRGDDGLRKKVLSLLNKQATPPPVDLVAQVGEVSEVFDLLWQEGNIIGRRYKLKEKIGQGGYGEVWKAHQSEPLEREVAVKVIRYGVY